MIKRKTGFTLVELIIVMGILGFVLAAMSTTLVGMLNQYRQQSKISESNIEGIIGLELLRQDIERAGYGLPWVIPSGVAYNEGNAASTYNDCSGTAPCNPPHQILSGNNNDNSAWIDSNSGIPHSDYLVIKAANISRNASSQRWTYLTPAGVKSWSTTTVPTPDDPQSGDYVIVLQQGTSDNNANTMRNLVSGGTPVKFSAVSSSYLPPASELPRFVYGISDSAGLMPFNRADYFIAGPNTALVNAGVVTIPNRCAPNTGVLVKETDGNTSDVLPLLDCVADMEVVYRLDTDGDGKIDTPSDDITSLSAQQIRAQLKEIRVYVLAHEGQRDNSYTYPWTTIYVGDKKIDGGLGPTVSIGTNVNYRWKLYTIVVKPKNL